MGDAIQSVLRSIGASAEMAVTVLESFGGTPDICPGMKMAHDLVKIRDEADAI